MEVWLNVTESLGDDVFVPMAMTRESADDTEGEPGSCRSACGGCSNLSREDSFTFSLVI